MSLPAQKSFLPPFIQDKAKILCFTWILVFCWTSAAEEPGFGDLESKTQDEVSTRDYQDQPTDLLSEPHADYPRAGKSSDFSIGEARAEVARSLILQDKREEALKLIKEIEDKGRRALALAELGIETARAGESGAAELLSRAWKLIEDKDDPHKDHILAKIALGYGLNGQWKERGHEILSKLEPSEESARTLIKLSDHFIEEGEDDQASRSLLFLRQILDQLPRERKEELLPRSFLVHRKAGKEDLALKIFEQIEERELKIEAEVLLARELLLEGDTEKAVRNSSKLLEKVEKLNGTRREKLLEQIGYIQAGAGVARDANKAARALDNKAAAARVQLKISEYFRLIGEEKKARSWLSKANKSLRDAPKNAERVITRGALAIHARRLGQNYKSSRAMEASG